MLYHAQVVRVIDCPKAVLGVLAGILVLAGVLSYTVGKDFLPPLDEGYLDSGTIASGYLYRAFQRDGS